MATYTDPSVAFAQQALNQVNAAGGGQGVYWQGADGKVYVKGSKGTNSAGAYDNNTQNYWNNLGYSEISDPARVKAYETTDPVVAAQAAAAANTKAQDLASYDMGIGNTNRAITRLDSQLNSGVGGLENQAKDALATLLTGFNQAKSTYNDNITNTKQGYIGQKNNITAQAGQGLTGLQRLLGSHGAGGGSAYTITAPGAVARQATLQSNDAGNTFNQNLRGLDTAWGQYNDNFNAENKKVNDQKTNGINQLRSTIDQNKGTLLQQLADLQSKRTNLANGGTGGVAAAQDANARANALYDSAAQYVPQQINFAQQAYQAPSLASYAQQPTAAPTVNGQAPQNDYFSPQLGALLNPTKDKRQAALGVG